MSTTGRALACASLLGLAGLLALPPSVAAQDAGGERDLTSMSLEELARTKVTSVSRSEEPRFRTPAAVHVVTADDIRRAGATSIPEALRLVPGVHVARINSSQWAIGFRGFTSRLARSQLALIDGRSLYTPLFAGTYWEVQDTLLEDVLRIEVVRGPGGTLWGANAVNGIVNVITKDARDTQGWLISAGAGPEERVFANVRYGGRLGSAGHYRVYGRYFDRDAAFHPAGNDFDGWHMAQGGFRADWHLHAEDRLTVQGDAYSGRAGEQTSLTYYDPPFSRSVTSQAQLSGGNLTTHWDRPLGSSKVTLFAYYDRTHRGEPNFTETRDTFDVELQDQLGVLGRHQVVGGLGYRLSSGRGRGIETVAFLPPDRTDHLLSAFVQDEIDLVRDRLRLGVGAKVERNQYTGLELQPSARLLWAPGARQAVWAGVTRAVRTPSRVDRDLSITVSLTPAVPLFARVLGDAGFTSEKEVSYEAGYRVLPAERLSLDLALFHNRYSDLFSLETAAPFVEAGRQIVPLHIGNGLRGRASGGELSSTVRLTRSWEMAARYSYLDLDLTPVPGSTDTTQAATAGASPRHMLHCRSSWDLPRHFNADLGFRWVDALPSQQVPSYAELDARLGWLPVRQLELALVGQSLLHDHHREFGAALAPQIQRSVYAEARWRW